jgi:hypothetical protein
VIFYTRSIHEIKEENKEHLRRVKEWDAEWKELLEKRRQEERVEKEHKKEVKRKHAAQRREEREQKFERVRHAKAAMEENPDALRKGKWPCCTGSMQDLLVLWFSHAQSCQVLQYFLCCHVLDIPLCSHILDFSLCFHLMHLPVD